VEGAIILDRRRTKVSAARAEVGQVEAQVLVLGHQSPDGRAPTAMRSVGSRCLTAFVRHARAVGPQRFVRAKTRADAWGRATDS